MSWPSAGLNQSQVLGTRRIQKIISIGDSIIEYQGTFGMTFAPAVNVTGVEIRYGTVNTPAGSMTLAYNKVANTLTYTAPGDTAGAPVIARDGLLMLPSGNPAYLLRVGVYSRLLPATDQADVKASNGVSWRRGRGAFQYVIDAFTNRRFTFMEDLGITGNYTSDMIKRYDQALDAGASLIIDEGGTNDEVAGSLPAAGVIANRKSMWTSAMTRGIPVIGLTIAPRFGVWGANGVAGNDPGVVTTQGPTIVQTNNALIAAGFSPSLSGIYVANNFRNAVDPITGKVRDYYSTDGVHCAGSLAIAHALPCVQILDTISPDVRPASGFNIGVGSYYNATTNPSGNLLTAPQGSFGGSGGTLGTIGTLTPRWVTLVAATASISHVISAGNLYRAVTTGVAGTIPPSHLSGNMTDGGVIWQFLSAGALIAWVATTAYGLGEQVVTTAGRRYSCTTAGTTAGSEPTSVTSPVTDGTAIWAYIDNGHSAGFGSGYSLSRAVGTGMLMNIHKMADPDGGPDWQEFIIFGATRDVHLSTPDEVRIFPSFPSIGNFATADPLDTSVEAQLPYGAEKNFYGIYMDQIYTGGGSPIHDNQCLWSCFGGIPWTEPFTLALEPMALPAGVTAILPRVMVQAKNGVVSYLRLRNFDVHKVI